METNGRHAGRGTRDVITDEDNVVRLPREWLGPPGALVPFAEEEPVPSLETPDSTHDFWGEALADDFSVRVEPAATASRARVRHRALGRLRWPWFARDAHHARRLPAPALLGAAGALVIVALAIGNSAVPSGPARRSASVSHARSEASSGLVAFVPHGTLASSPARSRTGSGRRHPSVRDRTSAPRHVTHRAAPTHTTTIEPVRYATSTPTTSTYPTSSTPQTSASTPSSAAAATGASAGSHQPATGAAGALGPGTSPDG